MNGRETVIGRQKFIAELGKLLAGMAPRDREATLAKYQRMFDEAWNEDDLIIKLGSPTRAAICELRGYVPSAEPEPPPPPAEQPASEAPDEQSAPGGLIEPEPMPETLDERLEPVKKAAPPPTVVESFRDTPPPPPEGEAEAGPGTEGFDPSEAPDEQSAPGGLIEPEPMPETLDERRDPIPEKNPLNPGRTAAYTLFGLLVCLPAAAAIIVFCLAVLALGVLAAAAGVFTVSLGFTGISVFSDIMLLAGAGLVLIALGIPAVFFAAWLFLGKATGFVSLVLRTGEKWCRKGAKEVPQA